MESRGNKIFEDGQGDGYVANNLYTEDQYKAFWDLNQITRPAREAFIS